MAGKSLKKENEIKEKISEFSKQIKELKKELKKEKKQTTSQNTKDVVRRIGNDFNKEFVEIEKLREEKKMNKLSRGDLTNLVIKHTSWKVIRKDLLNFDREKI